MIEHDPRLRRLRDYVDRNLQDDISLEEAARQAGLERTYFSTYFHKTTGCCFCTWLRMVRVDRALELLRSNDRSITELAFDVGYRDLTTFERAFKRTVGCTPSFLRDAGTRRGPKTPLELPKYSPRQSPPHSSILKVSITGEPITKWDASDSRKEETMARQTGREENRLQVRGSVDAEKFKAARTLGGGEVKFELRAMRPVKAGQADVRCIVCFVCFVCIVCIAANAERLGIRDLPALEAGA